MEIWHHGDGERKFMIQFQESGAGAQSMQMKAICLYVTGSELKS